MSWLRIDDQFTDHPKIVHAGGDAAWLHVCGLVYCARYLTDGEIPKPQVPRLSDRKNPQKLAKVLCDVGLWFDAGNAYIINDYLEHNPSRAEVETQRAKERAKKARGRANQGRGTDGRITGESRGESPGDNHGDTSGESPFDQEGIPTGPVPVPVPEGFSLPTSDVNEGSTRTGEDANPALGVWVNPGVLDELSEAAS